jgi:hypothetical protein
MGEGGGLLMNASLQAIATPLTPTLLISKLLTPTPLTLPF